MLDAIEAPDDGSRAIVLEGEAGVGKTALWCRALDVAAERGWRILSSAPAGSEARLAFAALGDLLDLIVDDALPALPRPQRRGLEVALLRGDSDSAQDLVDERTIGVATLSALRVISARAPLVLAIDDLQWVDASSAAALRFALRRLRDEPVLVLATRRVEAGRSAPLELERTLGDERVQRLNVGPLSLGGVHELLVARLGFEASRSTLVRLQELAGGNPFYSLEIGRELIARGGEPAPDEALPVPGSVSGLVQTRLSRLSPAARTVLLAAAALARPTRAILSQVDEHADVGLDEALAAGLIREALAVATEPGVRTRALAVLGTVAGDKESVESATAHYRRALREPASPCELRADLHQKLAWLRLLGADAKGAERHARAMLGLADGNDPTAKAAAAATVSLVLAARARPVLTGFQNQVRSSAGASEQPWAWSEIGPAALQGVVLLWAGRAGGGARSA